MLCKPVYSHYIACSYSRAPDILVLGAGTSGDFHQVPVACCNEIIPWHHSAYFLGREFLNVFRRSSHSLFVQQAVLLWKQMISSAIGVLRQRRQATNYSARNFCFQWEGLRKRRFHRHSARYSPRLGPKISIAYPDHYIDKHSLRLRRAPISPKLARQLPQQIMWCKHQK